MIKKMDLDLNDQPVDQAFEFAPKSVFHDTDRTKHIKIHRGKERLALYLNKLGYVDTPLEEKFSQDSLGSLHFPFDFSNGKKATLDIVNVLKLTEKHLVNPKYIKGIVLFGSSVRLRRHRAFGLFKTNSIEPKKTPNDIDIFLLLDKNVSSKSIRLTAPLESSYKVCGAYRDWTEYGFLDDGCDIFALNEEDFEKELAKKSDIAESIVRDGVLLLGEFHRRLDSKVRIEWDGANNPSLTLKD